MREAIRCNQMQSDRTIRMTSRHLPEPACNEGGDQMQSDAIRSHHPDDLPSPSRAGRAGRWHNPPPRASRHTSRPACAPYGAHTRHTTCGGDSRRFEEIRGDSRRFGAIRGDSRRFEEIRGDSRRFGRRPKVNTASTKRAQSEHEASTRLTAQERVARACVGCGRRLRRRRPHVACAQHNRRSSVAAP